jgi:hypothetical protein
MPSKDTARELAILARVTWAVCSWPNEMTVDASGSGSNRRAMTLLKKHGMIRNLHGVGRGIRGEWVTLGWLQLNGPESEAPDLAVLDAIAAMLHQHLGDGHGGIVRTAHHFCWPFWSEAADYLASLGVVRLDHRSHDSLRGEIVDLSWKTRA